MCLWLRLLGCGWRVAIGQEVNMYAHHEASSTTTPFRPMLQGPHSLPFGGIRPWLWQTDHLLGELSTCSRISSCCKLSTTGTSWVLGSCYGRWWAEDCHPQFGSAHDWDEARSSENGSTSSPQPWPPIYRSLSRDFGVERCKLYCHWSCQKLSLCGMPSLSETQQALSCYSQAA